MSAILQTEKLSKFFGGLRALQNIDLEVRAHEILGMIGPNGAGKTTFFNAVCGVYAPEGGKVFLEGKEITGMPTHRIARMGIGRTFQIVKPFMNISVERNILAALGKDRMKGISPALLGIGLEKSREEVRRLLRLVGIESSIAKPARTLTLGHQKRMEIARALALKPKLLMLDEPFAGLSQEEIRPLVQVIKNLKAEGITILLIEHNVPFVMEVCDRLVVLNFGEKLCKDPLRKSATIDG
ncbi:MAG: ABC transporter ATP-binding protein [Deltaproteobacteria bacterium]|nr:ABC transporter ATP-binding protein [Deltaproteobacteria bacterium]